jgi:hypothetical protein
MIYTLLLLLLLLLLLIFMFTKAKVRSIDTTTRLPRTYPIKPVTSKYGTFSPCFLITGRIVALTL